MKNVSVIGGGAAGMMAAVIAARSGARVTLFEKNEKLGKKIYITGKGRCNLTNACDMEELFAHIVSNSRFLYSAFYGFSNHDTIEFFKELGLAIKIERGNRVFPQSDHSSDVIKVLAEELKKQNVQIKLNTKVEQIIEKQGNIVSVQLSDKQEVQTDACIITTGGLSYSSTGSTGDGYEFAKKLGHKVTPLMPSLVSIHVEESFITQLEGLSLKNISLRVMTGKPLKIEEEINSKKKKKINVGKLLYEEFGELVFTRFGISGPLALSASSHLIPYLNLTSLELHLDLKPALSKEQLDSRILRDFNEMKNKQFKNALDQLLPQKIIPIIIEQSKISKEKQVNAITKEERSVLVDLLKDFVLTVKCLGGYNEAVITKGGVSVKEINPSTMESKLVKGLYFAGEVLDLDGLTGGFNLQIAWSTGYLAGSSAAKEE